MLTCTTINNLTILYSQSPEATKLLNMNFDALSHRPFFVRNHPILFLYAPAACVTPVDKLERRV